MRERRRDETVEGGKSEWVRASGLGGVKGGKE
jgi:hypothetical protein